MAICTGCSLLCEDIDMVMKAGGIATTKNLCRSGSGHFYALSAGRTVPMVDGAEVSIDKAISAAGEILRSAKSPLLYGWSNSSMEAQREGIDLARKLGATIDDSSSLCQGTIMDMVLRGRLPTCTLDDVRNFADVVIFWGSDPANSQPRHLSRFSYYPRGEKRQKGYEEDRNSIAIDVRKSATAKLCKSYFQVAPGEDSELIAAVISVLGGKVPKFGDKKKLIELGRTLKKAEFGAIFPGAGLASSIGHRTDLLEALLSKLNGAAPFKVLPMLSHYNARGFNQLLLNEAGYINMVSFKDGVSHGKEHGVTEASKSCDTALVVGSDPISSLPSGVGKRLSKVPLIAIDPHSSLTTDLAKVVIPSAYYGLEAGGTALRMDGIKISFKPVVQSERLTDEEIVRRIEEEI
jgi:formylmethanofuran dehydrogenase subunit B